MKSHRAGGNRSPIPSTGAQPRSPSTDLVLTFHVRGRHAPAPLAPVPLAILASPVYFPRRAELGAPIPTSNLAPPCPLTRQLPRPPPSRCAFATPSPTSGGRSITSCRREEQGEAAPAARRCGTPRAPCTTRTSWPSCAGSSTSASSPSTTLKRRGARAGNWWSCRSSAAGGPPQEEGHAEGALQGGGHLCGPAEAGAAARLCLRCWHGP
jgi:hypothetical protein